MAKTRKPIEMQRAHLTVVEKQNRKTEEETVITGKNQLKKAPSWLNDSGKKEWRRINRELDKIEIIGNLDYANLAGYCNAYAKYVEVTEQLQKEDLCLTRLTRTGEIIVKNPLIDIQKTYAEEMRKFASLCGMTIDSRLKAAVTKTERTQVEIAQKFGNI